MEVHQFTEMEGIWLEKSRNIFPTMIVTPLFAGETVKIKMQTINMSSGTALLLKTIREGYTMSYKTFLNLKYPMLIKPYILDIYLKNG